MIVLGIVVGILALAILAMSFRLSGLKTDALDADQKRHTAEQQLQQTAREFVDYKERTQKQLADVRADVASLEEDLVHCSTPGALRARLNRLLSKAAKP